MIYNFTGCIEVSFEACASSKQGTGETINYQKVIVWIFLLLVNNILNPEIYIQGLLVNFCIVAYWFDIQTRVTIEMFVAPYTRSAHS
jgi:hypothetical protein